MIVMYVDISQGYFQLGSYLAVLNEKLFLKLTARIRVRRQIPGDQSNQNCKYRCLCTDDPQNHALAHCVVQLPVTGPPPAGMLSVQVTPVGGNGVETTLTDAVLDNVADSIPATTDVTA